MTHSEIYKKFFIEYDKDMITSSYPSLTLVEVSNFLNKAYLALIAQKFTGNNLRLIPFEGDTKQLEDLQPLVTRSLITNTKTDIKTYAINEACFVCPNNMLYYIDSHLIYIKDGLDEVNDNVETMLLVSHEYAKKFMCNAHNCPWIETPVCTIHDDTISVYYDKYKHKTATTFNLALTYIAHPTMFNATDTENIEFELNDSVVEELINLAITFVLDNVESSRIQTKTNLLKLES